MKSAFIRVICVQLYNFTYEKFAQVSRARAGVFHTPHGDVLTPAFMPVGTQATVKGVPPRDLVELGARLVLSNTYHLYLRPGDELIARMGGLHRFMGWAGPILTDSGGFQVFSLRDAQRRRRRRDLQLHLDGSMHRFTPEKLMRSRRIWAPTWSWFRRMCAARPREYNEQSLRRTHAWAGRCKRAHTRSDQALFGIVQGGGFADLREQSAQFMIALDFPGYAIGGLAVGETKEQIQRHRADGSAVARK